MANDYTICVATVGGGLSVSPDGGETWNRIREPLPSEANVRALTVYPDDAHRIIAGTDIGIFRSDDNGPYIAILGSRGDQVKLEYYPYPIC